MMYRCLNDPVSGYCKGKPFWSGGKERVYEVLMNGNKVKIPYGNGCNLKPGNCGKYIKK